MASARSLTCTVTASTLVSVPAGASTVTRNAASGPSALQDTIKASRA